MGRDCTKGLAGRACYRCGKPGHLQDRCPENHGGSGGERPRVDRELQRREEEKNQFLVARHVAFTKERQQVRMEEEATKARLGELGARNSGRVGTSGDAPSAGSAGANGQSAAAPVEAGNGGKVAPKPLLLKRAAPIKKKSGIDMKSLVVAGKKKKKKESLTSTGAR